MRILVEKSHLKISHHCKENGNSKINRIPNGPPRVVYVTPKPLSYERSNSAVYCYRLIKTLTRSIVRAPLWQVVLLIVVRVSALRLLL